MAASIGFQALRTLLLVAASDGFGTDAGIRDQAEAVFGSVPAGEFVMVAHSAGGVVAAEVMRL